MKLFSKGIIAILLMVILHSMALAQSDTLFIRQQIEALTTKKMAGRGYVKNGMQHAAKYIAKEMKSYGLQPIGDDFLQSFEMSIVQYPNKMQLKINGQQVTPGTAFLIDPFSASWSVKNSEVLHIDFYDELKDLSKIAMHNKLKSLFQKMQSEHKVMILHNTDSLKKWMDWKGIRALSKELPTGKYIVPMHVEPLWFPAPNYAKAQIIYIYGKFAQEAKSIKTVSAKVTAKQDSNYSVANVVGYLPAAAPTDSYIVFTAHYDHIGMMGKRTMFAGASDNASGTAMMLNLARYYAKNPGKYNIVFIACAAEEAGLLGSVHFADNPMIPLANIKFLINLDIWGDATGGVTVINGKVFEKEFQYVVEANKELSGNEQGYFKEIRQGEEAFNSDHAPFYAKGVKSFFFFTIGGPGNYHDVEDVSSSLKLTNLHEAALLIKKFVAKLEQ